LSGGSSVVPRLKKKNGSGLEFKPCEKTDSERSIPRAERLEYENVYYH